MSAEEIICNGTKYTLPEEKLTYKEKFFWIYLAIYVALVLAAGSLSDYSYLEFYYYLFIIQNTHAVLFYLSNTSRKLYLKVNLFL